MTTLFQLMRILPRERTLPSSPVYILQDNPSYFMEYMTDRTILACALNIRVFDSLSKQTKCCENRLS